MCHGFTNPLGRGGSCTRPMVVDKRLNTLDFIYLMEFILKDPALKTSVEGDIILQVSTIYGDKH